MTYFPNMNQETIDKAFQEAKLQVEIMVEWKYLTFNIRLAHNRDLFNPPEKGVSEYYLYTPKSIVPMIIPHPCAV